MPTLRRTPANHKPRRRAEGASPAKPAPMLEDAKRIYIAEKLDGTDSEYRKKLRRVERIVEAVNAALVRSGKAIHPAEVHDHGRLALAYLGHAARQGAMLG